MEFTKVTEGLTEFLVPVQDETDSFPPGSAPVFFNPAMELSRDATVLLLSLLQPDDYLDVMGASGVRGLRAARECGIPVTINDRNDDAVDLIEENAGRVGGSITVVQADANVLLSGRSFDAVELDPFGSPASFLDAAVRCTRRYLFVAATDTAPLCGSHLKAGIRRYFARPANTEYHSEMALRVMLGFAVREVVKYDRGIEPIFCFARRHYVRLHLRLSRGAGRADKALASIGFVYQCPACPWRTEEPGILPESHICPECGAKTNPAGPLWLGPVSDPEIMDAMAAALPGMQLGRKAELERLIALCRDELPFATFYDYHQLAKRWGVSPLPIAQVLESLRNRGFQASRTHHAGTGIKTDAPLAAIRDALMPG